jgi:peptide/nickel transport system substrate-binding protein
LKNRLGRLVLAVVLVLAALIWVRLSRDKGPVNAPNAPESAGPATGGTLVATYRSEPRSFNRLVSPFSAEDLVTRLTQDTLVRQNRATGQIEPRLAREWTVSPDGLTWTLGLREGVKFSDGEPFTSADVLFTFRALYDPRVKSDLVPSFEIDGKPLTVRAPDDRTILITLPAPYGPGIAMLDSLPILPRHRLAAALEAGTFRDAWGVTTPLNEITGLGPFAVSEYASGDRLVLTRNLHFYRQDDQGRPLPYLDRLELRFVADQNAEILRLEAGEADLMTDEVRAEDIAGLKPLADQGRLRLLAAGVSISPDGLWFNLRPDAAAARARPWLQREELRRAISLAVNRAAIVDRVYLGAAEPVFGPITPGHGMWYLPDLPRTDFNPSQARTLLSGIGLTDRDGDGMLDDSSGRPARFSMLTQKGNTVRERAASVIQDQLRQVGLAVDVVPLETGAMVERWGKGEYEAMYFGVRFDSFDPARNLEFWLSSGGFHFWNAGQSTPATDWEAAIDRTMRLQASTVDPTERRRLFADVQRTLASHLPILYFAAARVTAATSARLHGATPSVLSPMILWNAEMLSIAPSGGGASRP